MHLHKKYILGGIILLALLVFGAIEFYIYKSADNEKEVIASLVTNWKSIAPEIIPNYPASTTAFYGYPTDIQFIGNNKIIIGYQTDFNPFLAVLSYDSHDKFAFVEQQLFDFKVPLKDQEWISKYGSRFSRLDFYKFSSKREGETVYPSDWVRVEGGGIPSK